MATTSHGERPEMSKDKSPIDLDDLLRQLASSDDSWPETDEEIRAVLSQSAQPFNADDRMRLLARILGADSELDTPREADPAPTLFDHLDDVRIAAKVDIPATALASHRGNDQTTIVDLYELVVKAYKSVRNLMPVDFIVLDPTLNAWFIGECRNLGATVSEYQLNNTLFNSRKNGKLAHLPPSVSAPVSNDRFDEYAFASEMGLRLVQERWYYEHQQNVALDRILADPKLRDLFDQYAARIAGRGYSTTQLRWGALAHRKAARGASFSSSLTLSMFDQLGRLRDVRPSRLPSGPGIYLCRSDDQDAYIATTDDLRRRIERHLAVGPNLVPDELECRSVRNCTVGIVPMPEPRSHTKRSRMVAVFKRQRQPMLNFLGLLPYAAA